MKILGLSHVLLCATDLAQSRAFYVDVLGFEVLEEDPEHGGVFLALRGAATSSTSCLSAGRARRSR